MKTALGAAALYHRVSTRDQNPKAARRELRAAAKRFGYRVALDIEETGSGANNDRPGLLQVMDAARRGKVAAVMVWKLDRFGRSVMDLLANVRELNDNGVRFIAITQGLDIKAKGDAMSRLILTMLSAVSEFERDLISERTLLGLRNAVRAGKTLGRPKTPRPALKKVLAMRSDGLSWPKVAAELGCTEWAARQAVKEAPKPERRPVKKGGRKRAAKPAKSLPRKRRSRT